MVKLKLDKHICILIANQPLSDERFSLRVDPDFNLSQNGGGLEWKTFDEVPVRFIGINKLKP
jgi:hypothetical protein